MFVELRRLLKMKEEFARRVGERRIDFLSLLRMSGLLLYEHNAERWAIRFWTTPAENLSDIEITDGAGPSLRTFAAAREEPHELSAIEMMPHDQLIADELERWQRSLADEERQPVCL